jgi:ABC-type sugar transport system permease subunit
MFDIVWQLTRGGPGSATETVSIYAYIRGFQQFDTSYVGAMVVVLVVLLSALLLAVLSCYMSDDFRGAVQAFVEKRKYTWTGQ